MTTPLLLLGDKPREGRDLYVFFIVSPALKQCLDPEGWSGEGTQGIARWGRPWRLPRWPRQCLESTVPRFSVPAAPWGGRGAWSSSPGFPQTSAVLPGSFWRAGNSSDLQGVWTADQSTFDFGKRGPVRELLEIKVWAHQVVLSFLFLLNMWCFQGSISLYLGASPPS